MPDIEKLCRIDQKLEKPITLTLTSAAQVVVFLEAISGFGEFAADKDKVATARVALAMCNDVAAKVDRDTWDCGNPDCPTCHPETAGMAHDHDDDETVIALPPLRSARRKPRQRKLPKGVTVISGGKASSEDVAEGVDALLRQIFFPNGPMKPPATGDA